MPLEKTNGSGRLTLGAHESAATPAMQALCISSVLNAGISSYPGNVVIARERREGKQPCEELQCKHYS